MKIDLKLLSAHLDQAEEAAYVPSDGVNDYLLNEILFPCMNREVMHLKDIDFNAFELDDVSALEEFHEKLEDQTVKVKQLLEKMRAVPPAATHLRSFC